jgi:hypothetical protein
MQERFNSCSLTMSFLFGGTGVLELNFGNFPTKFLTGAMAG